MGRGVVPRKTPNDGEANIFSIVKESKSLLYRPN